MPTRAGGDGTPGHEMFVLNTGAATSVASCSWYQSHRKWLIARWKKPGRVNVDRRIAFRFSSDETKQSFGLYITTGCSGCVRLPKQIHIFDCTCPSLLSLRGLEVLPARVDVAAWRLRHGAIKQSVKVRVPGNGHV